jgi:hypothetical protein
VAKSRADEEADEPRPRPFRPRNDRKVREDLDTRELTETMVFFLQMAGT